MLFGAFCALWAQNTGRRPLLWFILGVFFSVIAVLALLYKNSEDIKAVAQRSGNDKTEIRSGESTEDNQSLETPS